MKNQPINYCCESMHVHLAQYFKEPDDVDSIIKYVAAFDEYGIPVHDGGSSFIIINYCPWCGTKLPESKSDQWFKELTRLGFSSPLTDDIPERFKSSEWYLGNGPKRME